MRETHSPPLLAAALACLIAFWMPLCIGIYLLVTR